MGPRREREVGSTRRRLARGQAGRLLAAAGVLAGLWLFWSPRLQRMAQLDAILDSPQAAAGAMFSLCRTEGGALELAQALSAASEQTRAAALRVAAEQGCLRELPGALRAQHAASGDESVASAQIAAQQALGVEAAIEGLEGEDEARRVVALRALISLEPLLTLDQRRRAMARIAARPFTSPRAALLAESLAEAPRPLAAPAPKPDVPAEARADKARAPLELRMPELGESLKVGERGILYMAPAEEP